MFIPTKGKWHCNTDTYINVLAVYHVSDKGYVKLKAAMVNKRNGIVYPLGGSGSWGRPATIKLELKNIQHWKPYHENRF
jgi:hypothetical protein